ncbi:adhesion G protein-coupled receptor E3-like [Hippopotamus amphibius kiboko]|uniref:adhesion G protein-coupled receptor E3-like n=1 Tax=Hippopotamus amphibius kiboko TaxID=575201 RepID=UPI00259A39A2|nr:adhesion G protein-coupled receptor E3-like [Hippopotamus amphibius kiboko]
MVTWIEFTNLTFDEFLVTRVNECLNTQICPSKSTCTDTIESYFCTCKYGYESSSGKRHFTDPGVTCTDIDECQNTTRCPPTATCKNTQGGYFCVCKAGFVTMDGKPQFTGSGATCIDIDECQNTTLCPPTATCKNTQGSYFCVCKAGFVTADGKPQFTGSGVTCIDIDECQNTTLCPSTATCKNTQGGYFCVCKAGFVTTDGKPEFTGSGATCIDIDECQNTTLCPSTATCKNTQGGYFCVCKAGFVTTDGKPEFTGSGATCIDIDECQNTTLCPPTATCKNTQGGYFCVCKAGFVTTDGKPEFTGSGETCIGINSNSSTPTQGTFPGHCKQQEIANSFGNISNILTGSSMDSKEESALFLMEHLHGMQLKAYKAVLNQPTEGTLWVESQYMVIKALTIKTGCKTKKQIFKLQAEKEAMDIDCTVITGGGTGSAVIFISYNNVESILNGLFVSKENLTLDEKLDDLQLNSKVISGTTGCMKYCSLAKPVNFTFHHIQMIGEGKKSLCVYWNERFWSNEGCHAIFYDRTRTVCSCTHLSTFAILIASVVLTEDPVLTMITYVGLSLSLLCLLLASLTFLLCRPIKNTSTSLHLHLSICLFLAHFLFLTGINQTEIKVLCSVVAGALHYLYLASFSWMLLEGLHLFLTVRNLKVANYTSAGRFKKRFMYPSGYGLPAVIVAISAGLNPHGYGTPRHCWINLQKGFILSFLGPIAAIILINLTFYLITLWILRDRLSSLNKEVSKIQSTRMLTFKAIAQLFLLGCSWCLGFFLIEFIKEPFRSVIAYAFTITNVLQGFYIFLVHCLLNQQVREEYVKWFKTMSKRTESDSFTLSNSTTHTHVKQFGLHVIDLTLISRQYPFGLNLIPFYLVQ